MKVLFISYYYDPFPGVGAKRISYWANNIHNYGVEPVVITATEQVKSNSNIIFLPESGKSKLISKIIKDKGVNWELDLEDYFKVNRGGFDYDVVIVSGGPFMHFGISKFIKKNFHINTIIDYRDPFGNNPRHNDFVINKVVKKYYENYFNRYAEKIIVVNNQCKKGLSYSEKIKIINNGYDERVITTDDKSFVDFEKGLIVNGGKFYDDCTEDKLLQVIISNSELMFLQVGSENEKIEKMNNSRINSISFVPYVELIDHLNEAEITTVLTGGESFETPTKIYDYIALNKKILIITEGELYTGEIYETVKDYPNVIWAKNTKKAIRVAITDLKKMEVTPYDCTKFSRAYGLKKLVDIIKEVII